MFGKQEGSVAGREGQNENVNSSNHAVAAVHFYPQQKEHCPVRKSHPLRQESD